MSWGERRGLGLGRRAGRRGAPLAGVLLCLLAWMPLPLGFASAHMVAGWTPVCTSDGVKTVLLEDSGDQTEQRGSRHCTLCWGQAPEHEMPLLTNAPVSYDRAEAGSGEFSARDEVFPRALFRFQTRSRAPPVPA